MRTRWRRLLTWVSAGLVALALSVVALKALAPEAWGTLMHKLRGEQTEAGAAGELAPKVGPGLAALFAEKGCKYPPERLTFVALKAEKRLEVWAPGPDGQARLVKEYPVLAASGRAGPKLREGDRQVPEGVYRVVGLNPQSQFHLSIKLDYPNEFDREMARREGRDRLGGDIFIHGEAVSIGCLAMGDPAIEELFLLVSETGQARVRVIIAPSDFRRAGARPAPPPGAPEWAGTLYEQIDRELAGYRK